MSARSHAARPDDPAYACRADHCVTCADEGVPMRVCRVDGPNRQALCRDDRDARSWVATELVGPLHPGAVVLVHAGVAIAHLAEHEVSP
jgi:hypothetical protein